MFGAFGLYRDGVIFGIVGSDGEIYLKTDDDTVEAFRAAGSRTFDYGEEGRRFKLTYWTLPSEALDDSDALVVWANRAYEVALRGAAKPKKPRQRRAASGKESARSRGSRPAG